MWGLWDQIKHYRQERKELAQFLQDSAFHLDAHGHWPEMAIEMRKWIDKLNTL